MSKNSILGSLATSALVALSGIGSRSPQVGESAPDFEAPSTKGTIRLSDYAGQSSVLLAFYFADFTPG